MPEWAQLFLPEVIVAFSQDMPHLPHLYNKYYIVSQKCNKYKSNMS